MQTHTRELSPAIRCRVCARQWRERRTTMACQSGGFYERPIPGSRVRHPLRRLGPEMVWEALRRTVTPAEVDHRRNSERGGGMKIILEFRSWEEHDAYVAERNSQRVEITGDMGGVADVRLPVTKRKKRRPWSEYEMEMVRRHWP